MKSKIETNTRLIFTIIFLIVLLISVVTHSVIKFKTYENKIKEHKNTITEYKKIINNIKPIILVPVTITAYTSRVCETDDTPFITASNKKVRKGIIALSRDLENKYDLKFGDKINLSIFDFQDRMHRRKTNQVDIFMENLNEAKEFGVRKGMLIMHKGEYYGSR